MRQGRAEVSCRAGTPGIYRVTGTLYEPSLSATAPLTVVPVEIEPSIQSVERGSSSANTDVVVSGTTGSCSRVGTLTLERTDVRESASGEFKARFRHVAGRLLGTCWLPSW